MKYRIAPLAVVTLAALTIAGCSKNPVAGEWDGTMSVQGITTTVHLSLGSDPKDKKPYVLDATGKSPGGEFKIEQKGTYDIDTKAKNLVFHGTEGSITVAGQTRSQKGSSTQTKSYVLNGDKLTLDAERPNKIELTRK